ncbi:PASTA domain-containing protein [Thermus sp.]|uniref:PASTA domain-containing protein n=1 Tax=Thermus sp. TaxID=275 RepID=UPI003220840B
MLLDDRYPVLETLRAQEGVTLYRVEGGLVFLFDVKTPEDKERFYRYRAAVRRLQELGLLEAQVSAKPGRHYVFFPEKPLARKAPPKAALEALAPLGFGREHLAMAEDGVAYLAPWPLQGGLPRPKGRKPGERLLGVVPGLFLSLLGLFLLGQAFYRYFNPPEYTVPDLVGKSAREAFLLLKDTGLRVEAAAGNDPTKPKDVVLAQDPAPGTRLREGRAVRLLLNQARFNPLPDLGGLREEEAEARLAELGFKVARKAYLPSQEPLGVVLAQDPAPGTPVPPGGGVRLRVAVRGGVLLPPAPPEPQARTVSLALDLPPEAEGKGVRLVLLDERGERVVYEGMGREGLRLEGSYQVQGEARFRLYLDGELFQEWAP